MRICLFIITLLFIPTSVHSQNNVGIGTGSPDSNAVLEMHATDKGVLIPRLSSAQRNGMTPSLGINQKGLLVFDNDSSKFFFWNGYIWQTIGCGAMGPQGLPGNANVQLYSVIGTGSTIVCNWSNYTPIVDLNLTITLTDTADLLISTTGTISPQVSLMTPMVNIAVFCDNTMIPQAHQLYTLLYSDWHISTTVNLPPGTYYFEVRGIVDINQSYCFNAGSVGGSQSSLIIQVFY